MTSETNETSATADVRAVIESWRKQVVAGNIDGIMSHYTPDVLAFDAVAQLQFKGVDAYRTHWKKCMEMCGVMMFDISELQTVANDDIAFSHYLCHCGGKDENGEMKSSWMRATVCHRCIGGKWSIVHEHFSAPFDMEGKAMFDLKP